MVRRGWLNAKNCLPGRTIGIELPKLPERRQDVSSLGNAVSGDVIRGNEGDNVFIDGERTQL